VGISACGGGGSSDKAAEITGEGAKTTETTGAAADNTSGDGAESGAGEGEGAAFRIGTSVDFDTLNPLMTEMHITMELLMLVYDPLIRINDSQSDSPGLASSYVLDESSNTWTFTIAEGAKWHDGKPVTSADVKFTYDYMMKNELSVSYLSYLTGINEVSCPDEKTVVIKTDAPKPNMLANPTPILPEHIWKDITPEAAATYANNEMIGSGPFKFDSKGDGFVKISRNPDYAGENKAKVDNIIFVYYENTDSMAQAMKIGEIDASTSLNPAQFKQLQEEKDLGVISGSVLGFTQIGLNVFGDSKSKGNPLLKDKVVRQAIHIATDKQKVVDMAYYGTGEPGETLINPGNYYHYEVPQAERLDFNTDDAAKLLEENGYKDSDGDGVREDKDGNKLSFGLISIADNVEEIKAAQIIADGCKKAGIEINLETMDDGALTDKITAADYDMFIWGWGGDLDPSVILRLLTTDEIGGGNEPGYSNPDYDKLFSEQGTIIDKAERKKLTDEMQRMAYEDCPYIILIYDNFVQGYNTEKWTGIERIPAEDGSYFFNLSAWNYLNVAPK
jgi:peptide/nickel transport system substrate-binding protein